MAHLTQFGSQAMNGQPQPIPLPFGTCTVGGQLIDPLQIMLKQPSAWSRKGRIFPHAAQSVSRAFQRATDDTAIVDLRFHDLRHDGASRLFEAGWPIERVALVTGHRDWNMLRRYTQLRAEDFHRRQSNAEASGQVVRVPRGARHVLNGLLAHGKVRFRGEPEGKPAGSVENDARGVNWRTRSRTGLAAITVSRSHRPT